MQQQGERMVRLASDVKLGEEDVAGISNIAEQDDGTVLVEFFDIRVAEKMKKKTEARKSSKGKVEPPPGLEDYKRPASKELLGPAYISLESMSGAVPKHLPTRVATPSRAASGKQTVLIKGLPKALLTDSCIEAMLQQAGLQDSIVSVSTTKGEPCGQALVTVRSRKDAQLCMKHCQGRCWDPSGKIKVEAMLVDTGRESEERKPGIRTTRKARNRSDTLETCTTVSTDVGASDNEEAVF
jgi:hypothetical protein